MKIEKKETAQKYAAYLYKKGNAKLLARFAQENNWKTELVYCTEGGDYWLYLKDSRNQYIASFWHECDFAFDLEREIKLLERPVGRKAKKKYLRSIRGYGI